MQLKTLTSKLRIRHSQGRLGLAALLAACSLLYACSKEVTPPAPAPESTRQTSLGTVVGFADRYDTWSWRGIPFAQAPVGELRWRAPQPARPWEGSLEALNFEPWCPQLPIPMINDTDQPWLGNEDCLYLNVSAPKSWVPGDQALPVMVWMHGGGNTVGSADHYTALRNLTARERVVTVSIHYRLGVLGWFSHQALREQAATELDASGNFGTLDTIAALHWVRDNIKAFGGDPGNVTVFGESAGGMNTFALLLSPLADQLFHRAISQSGLLITSTLASAENPVDAALPGSANSSTELLLRLLQADGSASNRVQALQQLSQWDSAATMTYLRAQSPQQLLEQMQDSDAGLYPIPTMLRDGVVLPAGDPLQQLARGEFNQVPVILGTNRDEMKAMMIGNADYAPLRFGLLPRVDDQALYDRVTGYGSDMWKAIGADEPARAMAAAGHEDIFVYRFDWDDMPSNWLMDLHALMGAGHSLEIPFAFYDLDNEMSFMPLDRIDKDNIAGAEPLARAMSSYWGEFAHNGDPARGSSGSSPVWSRWQGEGRYLIFDTAEDGGVRMGKGGLDRNKVFHKLAQDHSGLGGQDSICLAYTNLFGADAIFSFAAQCPTTTACAGAAENFCPLP